MIHPYKIKVLGTSVETLDVPSTKLRSMIVLWLFSYKRGIFCQGSVTSDTYLSTFICKSYFSLSSVIRVIIGEAWCLSNAS